MFDGDHDPDDLDWDEDALVPDESESCFASVPDQEIAKPKRSNHDLRKKGDDDFDAGEAIIGGGGQQRSCSTS